MTRNLLQYYKKLQPIYEEYIQRKNELNEKGKDINTLDKSDENKEKLRLLNEEYKKFYDDIKSKCRTVCSNESVLASCCVEIAYNYSKNKNDSGFKRTKTTLSHGVLLLKESLRT